METGVIAVVTGDLVNSSSLGTDQTMMVMRQLQEAFKSTEAGTLSGFEVLRGDSFQGIVSAPAKALIDALRIKTLVNSSIQPAKAAANSSPLADVRISIGIGEATYDLNDINISNGEAFQLSGKTLDEMKGDQQFTKISTPYPELNAEFLVYMKFLDYLTSRWSIASAEVVHYLLQGLKEQEIADILKRSQAAVNLRKKAAGWEEIKLLLDRYAYLITNKL